MVEISYIKLAMVIPGMYFLVKCRNESCINFDKILPSYIGSNGKFDIFHSFKLVRCGGCYSSITEIISILFTSCIWGYRGQLKNEKKVTTETDKKVHRIEIFDHNKGITWDWLVINVKPLQQHLVLENLDYSEENNNFSEIIEDMVIQYALSNQASKYYKKYEKVRKLLDFPISPDTDELN